MSASSRKTGLAERRRARARAARCPRRGARPTPSRSRRSATARLAVAAVVAGDRALGAVQDERDVAVRALHTRPHERQERKFDQPRRLSSTIALARVVAARRARRGCSAPARLAHVDDLDRRQRRAVDAPRQPQARAARGRSRAAASRCRRRSTAPRWPRAAGGDRPRVVARVALVLVGAVVLLVDDDQAERRRSARRPPSAARRRCAPRRSRRRTPLVVALAGAELGVQHRDRVAEARRRSAPTICGVSAISGTSTIAPRPRASAVAGGAQVDLGLARAGDAVQQQPLGPRRGGSATIASSAALLLGGQRRRRARARRPRACAGARRTTARARCATSPRASEPPQRRRGRRR